VIIPGYEQRYCAFVDILGFRELIGMINKGDLSLLTLRELLNRVHKPARIRVDDAVLKTAELRAQSISDAVAISTTCTPDGLMYLFLILEDLALGLLAEGYLLRGAIVKGPLYHDNSMVFGQALIEAYQLESNIARYPRIMVSREVFDDANNDGRGNNLGSHILQSEDGPYYLHVLRMMAAEISIAAREKPIPDASDNEDVAFVLFAGRHLQRRLNESVDDPKIFEKVRWFANYWNEHVERLGQQYRITGPGLGIKYTGYL
jgi:hypothetical protein